MNLFEEWLAAKAAETAANKSRVAIEQKIAAELHQHVPTEGSKTVNLDGFKTVFTQKINRKLDEKIWHTIVDQVPENRSPVEFVTVAKVSDAGCRWLQDHEPDVWKLVATAITEKPGKLGVKVEAVSEEVAA